MSFLNKKQFFLKKKKFFRFLVLSFFFFFFFFFFFSFCVSLIFFFPLTPKLKNFTNDGTLITGTVSEFSDSLQLIFFLVGWIIYSRLRVLVSVGGNPLKRVIVQDSRLGFRPGSRCVIFNLPHANNCFRKPAHFLVFGLEALEEFYLYVISRSAMVWSIEIK